MDRATINRLRQLRQKAQDLSATLIDDLNPFLHSIDKVTFRRLPDQESKKDDVGVTTTCSCLMALATANVVDKFFENDNSKPKKAFTSAVHFKWESSGLVESNAFTTTLVLRCFGILKEKYDVTLTTDEFKRNWKSENLLSLSDIAERLSSNPEESFEINKYPPSPAIVYWFVDAVERAQIKLPNPSWEMLINWAGQEYTRQVSRVTAHHEAMMDPIALVMAACLCDKLRSIANRGLKINERFLMHLPSRVELTNSIYIVFERYQSQCGIWPKYFPMFHYGQDAGSNYCFAFEMLEAVLCEFGAGVILESNDDKILYGLEKAVQWCKNSRFRFKDPATGIEYRGWNSGGQIKTLEAGKPESWATAVVHMFLHKLQEVLSDKIQDEILDIYHTKHYEKDEKKWKNMLDIDIFLGSQHNKKKLKDILQEEILTPLEGKSPSEIRKKKIEHKRSALLFGPPGTSKTDLARATAMKMGWPLILIDPSHFLKDGLPNIYSKADEVFNDLYDLSCVVILFDEMDALVRTREEKGGGSLDVTSRFLTTSMLPKLANLYDAGQTIFFMATNYQDQFDEAIKRPGRFDLLLCMWPPSCDIKLEHLTAFCDIQKDSIRESIDHLKPFVVDHEIHDLLDRFTFGEMKAFVRELMKQKKDSKDLLHITEKVFHDTVKRWSKSIILTSEKRKGEKEIDNPYEYYASERNTSHLQ
jgi:hypothetical protein